MKQRAFQPGRWCRRLLYTVSLTLLLSGIGFAWIQHLDQEGRAGDTLLQIKTKLIAVHGFSAMFFVLLLGTLLVSHIQRAWLGRKNRPNGVLFLSAVGLLTLSGYALYYLGNESLRDADAQFHLWLGVVTPALLGWHIWCGRRAVNPQKAGHSMQADSKPIALGSIQKKPVNGEIAATNLNVLESEARQPGSHISCNLKS
ncbi:MAG: hypothetical protein ACREFE_15740 [Limisphaerales bacterium]